jgi:hypothetical protein
MAKDITPHITHSLPSQRIDNLFKYKRQFVIRLCPEPGLSVSTVRIYARGSDEEIIEMTDAV